MQELAHDRMFEYQVLHYRKVRYAAPKAGEYANDLGLKQQLKMK